MPQSGERIRVAHIITRLVRGGAQENTLHTVRLHDRARYDVDLLAGPPVGAEGSLEDAAAAAGVNIVRVPDLVREPRPVRDVRALAQLTRLLCAGRYDIVHTHTSKAGFLGRWAARRVGRRGKRGRAGADMETPAGFGKPGVLGAPIVVHTPHGNIFDGYFNPVTTRIYVAMERRAARWTDRIIELTAGGVEQSLARGIGRREQYAVIHSGIDLAPYEAAHAHREQTRAELKVRTSELLIGGVGRLEPVKGFAYFIRAAQRVAAQASEARFLLAGTGSEAAALRREAAALGDRFQFLGYREDVPALMAALDVLVVPSLNEGMGRVILEAGAAGTPAVATRVGGIPDVVREGATGLLVPSGDAEALAEALLLLARAPDDARRLGEAARSLVVPEYGLESMVRRIEGLYESLLEEKHLDL